MRRATWTSLFLLLGAVGTGWGQALSPAGTGGVAALAGILEQLGANKRVLVIGAHPDDEDTQLLVLLSRGLGAQAAYLSLTRGEGGQNLIGAELGPGLGIIRTEELLAARDLDGARQYFTRAYDFGFSKSADESFRFWPRDSLLKDVLDVIGLTNQPSAGAHSPAGAVRPWPPMKFQTPFALRYRLYSPGGTPVDCGRSGFGSSEWLTVTLFSVSRR